MANFPLGFNETLFIVRLEKLVDKLKGSKDKSSEKMIDYLVDIKHEIESSCNTKLNLDKLMDQVKHEIHKSGKHISDSQLSSIKKKIKKKEKKVKGHALYISETMHLENYEPNEWDEMLFLEAKSNGKDKEDDKEEIDMPLLLIYGVTVSLCGLFLTFVPIPICKEWGPRLVTLGVGACANSLCAKGEENKKEDKKKK